MVNPSERCLVHRYVLCVLSGKEDESKGEVFSTQVVSCYFVIGECLSVQGRGRLMGGQIVCVCECVCVTVCIQKRMNDKAV